MYMCSVNVSNQREFRFFKVITKTIIITLKLVNSAIPISNSDFSLNVEDQIFV